MTVSTSIQIPQQKSTVPPHVNVAQGLVRLTITSTKFTEIYKDGCTPHLHFRRGDNWWAIEHATGPESLLNLYGRKLALDFFEYNSYSSVRSRELANILQSMPHEKGPIELGFIEQVQNFAQSLANSTMGG